METVTLWSRQGVVGRVVRAAYGVDQGHVGVLVCVPVLGGFHLHRLGRAPVLRSVKVSTLLVSVVPDRVRSVPAWPLMAMVTSPAGGLVSVTA